MSSFEHVMNQSKQICNRKPLTPTKLKKIVNMEIFDTSLKYMRMRRKLDSSINTNKFIKANQMDASVEYWSKQLKFSQVIMSRTQFHFRYEQFKNILTNANVHYEVNDKDQYNDSEVADSCSESDMSQDPPQPTFGMHFNANVGIPDITTFSGKIIPEFSFDDESCSLSFHSKTVLSFNTKFQYKKGYPWCIDGLCATGKTSSFKNIQKSNRYLNLIAHNLHVSNAMGYFFSSMKMSYESMESTSQNVCWDRTPYHNIFPWFQIWMCLSLEKRLENLGRGSEFAVNCDYLHKYLKVMTNETSINMFKCVNTILIVDSNVERATLRLRKRNQGNDYERSFWPNYIHLQNLYYYYMAVTYPEHFILIDLAVFDGDLTLCQRVLNEIVQSSQTNTHIFQTNFTQKVQQAVAVPPTATMFKKLNEPKILMKLMSNDGETAERLRPLMDVVFYKNIKEIANSICNEEPTVDNSP